jgi:hypothetical protein
MVMKIIGRILGAVIVSCLLLSTPVAAQPSTTPYLTHIWFYSDEIGNGLPDNTWYLNVKESSHDDYTPFVILPLPFNPADRSFDLYGYPDGSFDIRSRNSGKCLDIENSSLQDGAPAVLFTCSGGFSQRFFMDTNSPYFYVRLASVNSGLCLSVRFKLIHGEYRVVQETCGTLESRWRWVKYQGGVPL